MKNHLYYTLCEMAQETPKYNIEASVSEHIREVLNSEITDQVWNNIRTQVFDTVRGISYTRTRQMIYTEYILNSNQHFLA